MSNRKCQGLFAGLYVFFFVSASAASVVAQRSFDPTKVTIFGRTFFDDNRDGVQQDGEIALSDVLLTDQKRTLRSAGDGGYTMTFEPGPGPSIWIEIPSGCRLDSPWFTQPFPPQPAGASLETNFPLWSGGLPRASATTVAAFVTPKLSGDDDWRILGEYLAAIAENERPDLFLAWTPRGPFDDGGVDAKRLAELVRDIGVPVRWVLPNSGSIGDTKETFSTVYGPRRYTTLLANKRYLSTDTDIVTGGGKGDVFGLLRTITEQKVDVIATSGSVADDALASLNLTGAELVIAFGPGGTTKIGEKLRVVTIPELWAAGDAERKIGFALLHVTEAGILTPEVFTPQSAVAQKDAPESQQVPENPPESRATVDQPATRPTETKDDPAGDTEFVDVLDTHPFVKGNLRAALAAVLGR